MSRLCVTFLALLLIPAAALAHAMPNSTVRLSPAGQRVTATVEIPLSELSAALGREITPDMVATEQPMLEAYLREHMALKAADGRVFSMRIDQLTAARDHDHDLLRATATFTPPGGAGEGIALVYDAVLHRVMSHYALVYVETADGEARPLARLQDPTTAVVVTEPAEVKDAAAGRPRVGGAQIASIVGLLMALAIAVRGFRYEWGQRKRKDR